MRMQSTNNKINKIKDLLNDYGFNLDKSENQGYNLENITRRMCNNSKSIIKTK